MISYFCFVIAIACAGVWLWFNGLLALLFSFFYIIREFTPTMSPISSLNLGDFLTFNSFPLSRCYPVPVLLITWLNNSFQGNLQTEV